MALFKFVTMLVVNPFYVLSLIWPYCVGILLFAGFVVWNGGIVLGMSLHYRRGQEILTERI
jgi:hypothetical protein